MKVKTVLIIISIFLLSILITVIVLNNNKINDLNLKQKEITEQTIPMILTLNDMKDQINIMESEIASNNNNNHAYNIIEQEKNKFIISLYTYNTLVDNYFPDELEFKKEINKNWINYEQCLMQDNHELHKNFSDEIINSIKKTIETEEAELKERNDIVESSNKEIKKINLISFSIFTLLIIFLLLYIYYYFNYSLNILDNSIKDIGEGRYGKEINYSKDDELKIVAQSLNITAQKLLEVENIKNNFLANTSHELRTPLTSIRSFSQSLHDGLLGEMNKDQKEALEIIIKNTDDLTDLINRILELSKYDAGKYSLDIKPHNIKEAMTELVSNFDAEIKNVSGKITIDIDDSLVWNYDKIKICEVMKNLISNAIKYKSENPLLIIITAFSKDDMLNINIKDNGIGINDKYHSKIFNRFFQVENGITRKIQGSGLGLSIVKEIIKIHKGTINFESKENVGTEFKIKIPKINNNLRK